MLKDKFKIDLQLFADGDDDPNNPNPSGGNPTPSNNPTPPAGKTFTEEYVTALRNESGGYRTQLRTVEKAVKEFLGLKPEDKVEDWGQVLNTHKETSQKALEQATGGAKQLLIRAEVKVTAKDLNIVDADAAIALADLSKVQVTDDGQITGVKEALEALIKDKAYLVGKPGSVKVGSGSNPGDPGATDPVEQARKMAEERNKGKQAATGGHDPWAKQ